MEMADVGREANIFDNKVVQDKLLSSRLVATGLISRYRAVLSVSNADRLDITKMIIHDALPRSSHNLKLTTNDQKLEQTLDLLIWPSSGP